MKVLILVSMLALVSGFKSNALACSLEIDDGKQQLDLISQSIEFLKLKLWQVKKVEVNNYGWSEEGFDNGTSCSDYLIFEAKIKIYYKKGPKKCQAIVSAKRKEPLMMSENKEMALTALAEQLITDLSVDYDQIGPAFASLLTTKTNRLVSMNLACKLRTPLRPISRIMP